MSIYRRGRLWWIKLSTESGPIREPARTADKREAWEYHEKRKGEIWRQEKLGEAPPITWGEAVAKWLKIKKRGMPDKYRLRALGVPPGTALPLSLTQLAALDAMEGSTFNRTLSIVIAIHNAAGVAPPKVARKPNPPGRTRWLTAEEWERFRPILEAESPLLAQAAEFTLATGLRENNVLNLEWGQVDLRRRVAWLHGDQTKQGKPLGVPLNDAACAILEARRGIDKRWVFGNPDYPLSKASNRAWYEAVRKAKLTGFRWHDLRHTWASWHVMNGTRLERLQELGGWATLQMVRRYAHLSAEHLAEDAARVKPVSLRYNASRTASQDTTKGTMGG